MESAPGGDIEKGHKLSTRELAKVTLEVLIAIKYIHDKGYVHSDVKGDQVLLSEDGTSKLGDFGMLCTDGKRELGGSPIYMAPELFIYERRTKPVDLWALGVNLYMWTHG